MAKISIKFSNFREIRRDIARYVTTEILPNVLEQAFDEVKLDLPDIFVRVMRTTSMWSALEGDTGIQRDLSAHLGVTPEEIFEFIEEVKHLILNTIRFTVVRGRGGGGRFAKLSEANSLSFNITFPDLKEEFANLPSAKYTSKNGYPVPWISWIFNGAETPAHSIVYSTSLNETDFGAYSKTGRAVMIRTGIRNWSSSNYGIFAETDFVTDTLNSSMWSELVREAFSDAIQRVI